MWTEATMLRRCFLAIGAAAALALAGCANAPVAATAEVRTALAPTGTLRVALFQGTPTSLVVLKNGERAGVAYELGQLAARRLGVPVAFVEFPRAAEVFDAVKSGRADMAFTNASESRLREADFTAPLFRLESGYLVTAASRIASPAAIDQSGVSVGVAQGGTSHAQLSRELKLARVVPLPSLEVAERQLRSGELQAFASNKGILFELSDKLQGTQVLAGAWAHENFALGVPKGRPDAALAWLRSFADSLRGSAELQSMMARAGVRGAAKD